MNSTIIFLGLAALSFNTITANELNAQDLVQQDSATIFVDNAQQNQWVYVKNEISKITFENTGDEATIFNPTTVLNSNYTKTTAEVIKESNLVTEATEDNYQPIALEMSPEDRIAEANQIIETNLENEVCPLDFEKINRSLKNNKVYNNNIAVSADLKL